MSDSTRNGPIRVFVSYAWKAEEDSGVVAGLGAALALQGVQLVRDVRRIGYGQSIREFMDEAGYADRILLVLSEAYFRSPYCLYELRSVAERRDCYRRVFPVALAGCRIHDPLWWIDIAAYWEEQAGVLAKELSAVSRANTGPFNRALDDYADFRRLVAGFMTTLPGMNALTEEVRRATDFAVLVMRLKSDVWLPGRNSALQVDLPWPLEPQRWPPLFPPVWAFAWGDDRYGLWCDVMIGGPVQRFRWIEPGEFLMSSPEGEEGRQFNEGPQHVVRLTEGYWLADTACSQLVWRAMMGSNRNNFTYVPQNPVEQVSWDDVQEFLREVEKHLPGVKADLPTDAEWEYACRAGSETAFSWGDEITPDQANYDATIPYGDGPRGKSQRKIVPVKSYAPNPWGLYQMHGNVWEWCADGQRGYDCVSQMDPRGPTSEEAEALRVVRGGSWVGYPVWLRAAYRDVWPRGSRRDSQGFRFSLRTTSSAERLPEAAVTRDA